MTIASMLVDLDASASNTSLLAVAKGLATRTQAAVTGFAGAVLTPDIYSEGSLPVSFIEQDLKLAERQVAGAEAEFRTIFGGVTGDLSFRSIIAYGSAQRHLAAETRCADLIVSSGSSSEGRGLRGLAAGELAMESGRPVLVVPSAVTALNLTHVLVAWKETRESRLAAAASLPLLKLAARVSVVEIASKDDMAAARNRIDDVVHWLTRHGITAGPLVCSAKADDADQMALVADEQHADLVVAGAYGHGRLREWVLGGFTRRLLANTARCSLIAH